MKPAPKQPTFDVGLYFDAKRMENAGLLRPGTSLVIAAKMPSKKLPKDPPAPLARKSQKSKR